MTKQPNNHTAALSFDDSIWVVVPCFNEKPTIETVVAELERLNVHVLVIDDGSMEPVADLLSDHRVTVLRHVINLGQGAALQTGIEYALLAGASCIITFDADGQHAASDIPGIVATLHEANVDVVLGSRFAQGGRAINIPLRKKILLKVATFLSRALTGLPISDTHNGFRALSAHAAEQIRISQNGMAHASQFLSEIRRNRLSVCEYPVTITYTNYSLQKGQRISNAFNIAWDSMMELFRK
ncbi:MAG: glycosyltransferase family 2 protein [Bdellovibrionales bacterium]|nr:glycosyltransferase family 2 protein [Bdellovibrionales bacterium]